MSFYKYIIINKPKQKSYSNFFELWFETQLPLMLCSQSYLRQSIPLIQSNITENLNLNNFQLQSYIFQ